MNDARPNADGELTPADALRSATTIDAKARRTARWPAWLWTAMGVGMPVHLIGIRLLPEGWLHTAVVVLPLLLAVGGMIYSAVQRATSRLLNKLVWPVTAVFVVLTVGASLLHSFVFPEGAVLPVVLTGLLPAIPCFYGVRRVLAG
ncbi:hypothetical protein IQ251_00605 [Saccharopolyspora sp. HNM0983]|uniref:Transmembrane protein n=1 Tax=Saccharopolyspora montiporae TaxID=2781240 RepID=A0A929FZU8_9PSEU|nr:hypothetical protein [Saccharopolyspora sp. HNM0983]MBE9372938.1 hypothetical protein [Saccharopolyspora sp. HNM0983]